MGEVASGQICPDTTVRSVGRTCQHSPSHGERPDLSGQVCPASAAGFVRPALAGEPVGFGRAIALPRRADKNVRPAGNTARHRRRIRGTPPPPSGAGLLPPWRDRNGRFSPLKAVVLAGCIAPALWIAWRWYSEQLGAEPVDAALHEVGRWSVRFLLITLAVTPFRRIGRWARLTVVRRMLGVTAFAYLALHFLLYIVLQNLDLFRVGKEIVLRFYLTIGFVALLGLAALTITSTDRMIRRLGRRWPQLHLLVYPLTVLGLWHDLLQAKRNLNEATLMVGFFLWLMGVRLLAKRSWGLKPLPLLGLGLATVALTVGFEAAWYSFATGLDGLRVAAANLTPEIAIRPVHWLALAMLPPVALALLRRAPEVTPVRAASPGRNARPSA